MFRLMLEAEQEQKKRGTSGKSASISQHIIENGWESFTFNNMGEPDRRREGRRRFDSTCFPTHKKITLEIFDELLCKQK